MTRRKWKKKNVENKDKEVVAMVVLVMMLMIKKMTMKTSVRDLTMDASSPRKSALDFTSSTRAWKNLFMSSAL